MKALAGIAVAVGLCGCGSDAPAILAVDPSLIAPHVTLPIVIDGAHFDAELHGAIDDTRPLAADADWRIQIGVLDATAVSRIDDAKKAFTT